MSVILHVAERHVTDKALNTKGAESVLSEVFTEVSSGFPLYGLSPWVFGLICCVLVMIIIAYSVAGKGSGSHAGREEVRRAYRRKLAQEMARQDAEKIKAGEKPRRKWMQW